MEREEFIKNLMKNRHKETSALKLVLWIGAGIDMNSPTGLPNGKELALFLLEKACGGVHMFKEMPRLESVIECFHQFENNYKNKENKKSFLNGFTSFLDAKPNFIHYFAAECLKRGANIVTTNYEQCIPKAYEEMTQGEDRLFLTQYGHAKGYYEFRSEKETGYCGRIFYIHGIASDISTLGATLSQLKPGLSEEFGCQVERWLEEGYLFVFLGYSASDSLDVNPFFSQVACYRCSRGIYIKHTAKMGWDNASIIRENFEDENVSTLLKNFSKKAVIEVDTGHFLEKMLGGIPDKRKEESPNTGMRPWKEKFLSYAEPLSEEERLALCVQMCFSLGIDSRKILPRKWWKRLKKCTFMEDWYIRYYGFALGRLMRSKRIMRSFQPGHHASELERSDYWAAFYDYKRAAEVFGKPERVLRRLEKAIEQSNDTIVSWDFSSALNRWTDYILKEIIWNPFHIWIRIEKYRNHAENLIRIAELLIKQKDKVLDISQYITALRAYGILCVIFKKNVEAERYIADAVHAYEEISYTNGVIGTLSLQCISEVFCLCYGKDRHQRFVQKKLREMLMEIIKNRQFYYLYHFMGDIVFYFWSLLFGRNFLDG